MPYSKRLNSSLAGSRPFDHALAEKRRIGDREVEGPEASVRVLEVRGGEGVAAPQLRRRVAVQEHVHPRERPGGVVHLLAVDGDAVRRLVGRLEQQRSGAAGRVVEGLVRAGIGAEPNHLRHDAGDLGRGVELALALARLGSEVSHQVLVGVAEEVVALRPIGAEVEPFEDGDELGEPVLHLLSRPELRGVVEVGLVDDPLEVVGLGEIADDLVDPVADLLVALELHHVGEPAALGHHDDRIRPAGVPVRDVLHEEQGQHVVLVLRGVHAAPKLVAALPERGVELGFLQSHRIVTPAARKTPGTVCRSRVHSGPVRITGPRRKVNSLSALPRSPGRRRSRPETARSSRGSLRGSRTASRIHR